MCEMCGNRGHSLFEDGTTYTPTADAVNAGRPTYTVDQIADYLTTGYWEDNGGSQRAFNVSAGGQITVNLTGLTASAQAVARTALDSWEAVSGIDFVEVNSGGQISFDDTYSGAYAYSFTSGETITSSHVNISTSWAIYGSDYYLQTFIHEIGHALGLGHGGNYNGTGSHATDAAYENDSWQMSIMSYFAQNEAPEVDADFAFVATPQIADIAAIHDLYGTPTNVETGNTVYGDGNTTGRSINDLTGVYASTIVDNGGIDTIDLGSRSSNQNLSLVVDTFSDLNGKTGNFAIGRGTVIENAITGSGNDTITGNDANNHLQSGSGNDSLVAGAGNDTLEGGSGNDTMVGGTGNDTYYVDSTDDRIVENAGEGADLVNSAISLELRNLSNNIESLVLTGTADINGAGNGRKNTITGNDGDNILNGAWGNDTLYGGAGNDTFMDDNGNDLMVGGTGNDTYYVDSTDDRIVEKAGEGADLVNSAISLELRNLSNNIESLVLTGTADINGAGNGRKNTITGNDGDNILNGAWGNDTLYGGAGNDTFMDDDGNDLMVGGTGDDTYYVDSSDDRIVENAGEGADLVSSAISLELRDLSSNVESLVLTGTADINGAGNGRKNTITGNDGDNILNGAWGNDTLYGGAGDDTFMDDDGDDLMVGGSGADSFVFLDSFGTDVISDFNTTEIGEVLDFSQDTEITDYADLIANHLTEVGGNAVISDGAGNSVTLTGVGVADLTADDFLF